MEELGLVVRRQMPENRKNVYVYLTAQGRALRRVVELMLANLDADAAVTRSSPRLPSRASRSE